MINHGRHKTNLSWDGQPVLIKTYFANYAFILLLVIYFYNAVGCTITFAKNKSQILLFTIGSNYQHIYYFIYHYTTMPVP